MAACDYTKYVVVLVLALLAITVVNQCMKPSSGGEPFAFEAETAQQGVSARPSWPAPLPPRSYPELSSAAMLGDANSGVGEFGALPPQPVMDPNASNVGVVEGFAFMGGAPDMPNAALTSSQANQMLQNTMNGGAPVYNDPQLPLGDIHQVSMDATDPANFMYDRTVFAPLKRQYGADVDHLRGDIDIKQEFRGWFDARPATEKDITRGYFNSYLDVQQTMAVQDAQFVRSTPVSTLFNASTSPAGNQYVAYANV